MELLGLVIAVIVVGTVVEVMLLKRRDRRLGISYEDSRVTPTSARSAERWAELKRAAKDRGE